MEFSQNNISHFNRDVRTEAPKASPFERGQSRPQEHRKFVAKGHDAQLMDAQMNALQTTVKLMSGESAIGIIVKRDKFTITIRYCAGIQTGMEEIFYKHAIESVMIVRRETTQ